MDRVLIEPAELAALLEADEPIVIADIRWRLSEPQGRPEYEAGHLPGAQYVDLESELSGPHRAGEAGGRHPLPDPAAFSAAMRGIGVDPETLVVAYDADTSLAACRLWWLLTDAGHERVRVLNGGFAAWVADARPVETGPGRSVSPGTFVARPGQRVQIDGGALFAAMDAGNPPALVDVRAAERFRGEVEPLDPVAGHIPGAINLPSTGNLDDRGRFRPAEQLAGRFAGVGEAPVLYCGSGVTAAHSLLAMTVAGRTDGVVYPGSWSDWITDPSRPVATGPEQGSSHSV